MESPPDSTSVVGEIGGSISTSVSVAGSCSGSRLQQLHHPVLWSSGPTLFSLSPGPAGAMEEYEPFDFALDAPASITCVSS
mmetsp:Transcript_19685/g.59710  ORF Transcript_19685/g.59710 Transcript_19685/m.59710 type:complete len:81 (-) Transcript_19685:382-624(-)